MVAVKTGFKVLISTYWNVNVETVCANESARTVLISTYWNVNIKAETGDIALKCFNLNLLECKYFAVSEFVTVHKF